ncbi:ComEA family DNA-binding protein [Paenibacillus sp. CMAA1364]
MRRIHQGIFLLGAVISSGYILLSGTGDKGGIEDWQPLNLQIAHVLTDTDISEPMKLNNEPSVQVPATVENITEPNPSQSLTTQVSNSKIINVNTANKTELSTLPGIGDKKAQAILDYRNEKGPFRTISDLEKVKGIGVKMLEKIAPLVEL